MAKCKGCVFFEAQESRAVRLAQDTWCEELSDPDLGTKLRGCKYEAKKEEEACQKTASSTNGSGRKKASRAKSAENI